MGERSRDALIVSMAGLGAALAARTLLRQRQEYDLTEKVVLITGGSRGLGLVLAREFATEGALLALCARASAELDQARAYLEKQDAEVMTVPCDVADREQVERMVNQVHDRFGRIEVLVNNAGIIQVGPIETMTIADYDEAMKVHFWGALHAILAVLPEMRQRHAGRIVNISSIGGKIAVPHLLPYDASKFALTGLSEGLRAELAKDGILVTTVCPGLMRTGSPPNARFKGQNQAEYAWFSILDSLPFTSMSVEQAAREIVDACKHGDAEVVLTFQAALAAKFHGLFPGTTVNLLRLVNRLLPGPGGIGEQAAAGKESFSSLSPSWLTALSDIAAQQNNEFVYHGSRTSNA